MSRLLVAVLAGGIAAGALGAVSTRAPAPELSAEQIVQKNVQARGGAEAWRKVQTMVWHGHMEGADPSVGSAGFVLEQKRPNKMRFQLNVMGQRTARIFDGRNGWKVRSNQDGTPSVQPFTPQELRFAQGEVVIDTPLIAYDPERVAVELDGIDQVEGRMAYRLILRRPSGDRHSVWIDAQTFLDVRYERTSYTAAGQPRTVSVFYRDFRTVDGLQIPYTIETGAGGKTAEKMVIDEVAVNPPVEDRTFARPISMRRSATVTIEAARK